MAALSMRLVAGLLITLLALTFSVIHFMRQDVVGSEQLIAAASDDGQPAGEGVEGEEEDKGGTEVEEEGAFDATSGGSSSSSSSSDGGGDVASGDEEAGEGATAASVEEGDDITQRPTPSADAADSICDLRHWVHGVFKKDIFIPTHMTTAASLTPPKAQEMSQKFHWFTKNEAEKCLRNKRVWVIGDSYMRNQYIGLMVGEWGGGARP